ncbi:hypothetical protein OIU74_011583 [Salix koriyanagi]|uniref:Uncharacterized protein n=1 Tax=Salix koriyanagi TaxID=2511006 RepID=A0A9Q0TFK6_9ROSI|nr:hypothetical protein OIU74_011583 [Salix koriyanagi]
MVTKSRLSPFANTKARSGIKEGKEASSQSNPSKSTKLERCFLLIEVAILSRKRGLPPVKKLRNSLFLSSELHRTLYGFIVFEVAWNDVRGINYLNELLTDTSLAIETKIMQRWEFDSIVQAASSLSSWFSGTLSELLQLQDYLDSATGDTFYDAEGNFSMTPSIDDDEKICDDNLWAEDNSSCCIGGSFNVLSGTPDNIMSEPLTPPPTGPYKRRRVISHIQDFAIFIVLGCALWQEHLYVLISVITVLIGFFDLYKNVPVLKATASSLFGPLFDWIETWEMVSRIKYLGTMLFLHNFEKAATWFLMVTHSTRSCLSVFTQTLVEPLAEILGFFLPLWDIFIEVIESLYSTLSGALQLQLHIPYSGLFGKYFYAPFRLVLALAGLVAFTCSWISEMIGDIWQSVNGIFDLAAASDATVSTYEVSMWRSLWNDLFSQVFRAVRSILNGFVAFFTACNRHRLSIYNHIQDFIQRIPGRGPRSQPLDYRNSSRTPETRSRVSEGSKKIHIR